jgi:hypothetical protein
MAVTTTLYNPVVNPDPLASGFLEYGQIPISPIYPFPPTTEITDIEFVYSEIPSLLSSATQSPSGITLDTDGTPFGSADEFTLLGFISNVPTGRKFSTTVNTGYAGFTNYTIDLDDIDLGSIIGGSGSIDSITLDPVSASFPALNPDLGFSVTFDLTILDEESVDANRAGFSLVLVTSDVNREIEIGFRENGLFAQNQGFQAGTFVPLDLTQQQAFSLEVAGSSYSLSAGGADVLSGSLLNYDFDPTTSSPPFPAEANPYNIPSFLFFGDNTDQAHAEFTLGKITVAVNEAIAPGTADVSFFDYEQFVRFQNPSAAVPTNQINGLPLAQLFDESFYLSNNPDVAAAVNAGALGSGFEHFVLYGVVEGRSPSTLFNEQFYLDSNPDVQQAVSNLSLSSGLQHFLQFGHTERRNPSSQFIQEDYLTRNPDVDAAVTAGGIGSAFEHYIEFGIDEGRLPSLALFEEGYYLTNNGDVANAVAQGAFTDGYEHFVQFGQQEGRRPSINFRESSYLGLHSDVKAAVDANVLTSGFDHYQRFGRFENRAVFQPIDPIT